MKLNVPTKYINEDSCIRLVVIPSAQGSHGNEHNPELWILDEHFRFVACDLTDRILWYGTYDKPGKYRILVKVIDIFGNDTSQAFDVEVK